MVLLGRFEGDGGLAGGLVTWEVRCPGGVSQEEGMRTGASWGNEAKARCLCQKFLGERSSLRLKLSRVGGWHRGRSSVDIFLFSGMVWCRSTLPFCIPYLHSFLRAELPAVYSALKE
ncbi:hypothetical protein E2C01_033600 [Portunus trituberculatus]|uniref:Uncharacterized protein n=1 Tax=Portunus trituberculatus TaxID=210409 RepID=A0A5B7F3C9_PORTR|nr:hypothetical protein [Portunus trituberculatus]